MIIPRAWIFKWHLNILGRVLQNLISTEIREEQKHRGILLHNMDRRTQTERGYQFKVVSSSQFDQQLKLEDNPSVTLLHSYCPGQKYTLLYIFIG